MPRPVVFTVQRVLERLRCSYASFLPKLLRRKENKEKEERKGKRKERRQKGRKKEMKKGKKEKRKGMKEGIGRKEEAKKEGRKKTKNQLKAVSPLFPQCPPPLLSQPHVPFTLHWLYHCFLPPSHSLGGVRGHICGNPGSLLP